MLQGIGNIFLQFCVTVLLGVVSFTGDRIVGSNNILPLRAICDNLTHATVGGLSWILILILTRKPVLPNVYSTVYCIAIASFIDVDHFFAAKSWKLRVIIHSISWVVNWIFSTIKHSPETFFSCCSTVVGSLMYRWDSPMLCASPKIPDRHHRKTFECRCKFQRCQAIIGSWDERKQMT